MAKPKFSVSEITTFHQTYDQDLAAYADAGVEGIGIWEFKLPARRRRRERREAESERSHGDDDDPRHALGLSGAIPRPAGSRHAHRRAVRRHSPFRTVRAGGRARPSRRSARGRRSGRGPAGDRRGVPASRAGRCRARPHARSGAAPPHGLRHLDDGLLDPGDDRADRRDRRAERAGPVRRLPPPRHRQRARRHRRVRQPDLPVGPHLRLARGDAQRLRPGASGRRHHRPAGDLRRAGRRARIRAGSTSRSSPTTARSPSSTSRTRSGSRSRPTCSREPRPASTRRGRHGGRPPDAPRRQGRARHGRGAAPRHRPRHGAGARRRRRCGCRERHRRGGVGGPGVRRRAPGCRACAPACMSPMCRCGARSMR